jgi:hypothetical protein
MINQETCAALWQHLSVSLNNIVPLVETRKGAIQMLGFADIVVYVAGAAFLSLPKTSLKLIRDRLHFDPQVIQGRGEKAGVFFPTWRPMTAEARAVIESLLNDLEEVQELIRLARASNEGSTNA